MKKGGVGVGSASIMLVFAVLCLTIFTLISLSTASADKALADRLEDMVTGYYEADTLAERVFADIVDYVDKNGVAPESANNVEITSRDENGIIYASFTCPINDKKELHVEVALGEGSYNILKWSMQDIEEWQAKTSIFFFDGK